MSIRIKSFARSTFMKFRFVWVGKTKDPNWKSLQEDYLSRLSHFVRTEIVELKDGTKDSEGKLILQKLNQSPFVCVLDVAGRQVSSVGLADEIENWQNRGLKEISFVIGGAEGVSSAVVQMADNSLSLSFLTFTHEMARVVLLEQLYRAFTIIKGFPYQK